MSVRNTPQPPKALKKPITLEMHNDSRVDNYYWMNHRENPEVIDYLKAENTYCDDMTQHTKAFASDLFEEMKARIKEDDESVPYKFNGYWYITKYNKGKDYPIYLRKKEHLDAPEELLFDCNEMAKGHSYFKLVGMSISMDNTKVAFGVDYNGRRQYTIQVKNLETHEIYKDKIENTTGASSWANDNTTLFYTKRDAQTLRAYQIYRHELGNTKDELIFEEADDTFNLHIYKTKSRAFLIIGCHSTLTNEYYYLDADTPQGTFNKFQERIRGLEYDIYHFEDYFYMVTNKDKAFNFKLMRTPISNTNIERWEEVIPHRDDVLLEGVDIFKEFLVLSERSNGLNKIRIRRWDQTADYYIPFSSETYMAFTSINVDFDTELLRYNYNALTTPPSVIEYNMRTMTSKILKEKEVLDENFDKDNYESQRLWAKGHDGVEIPISLVYKKGIKKDGKNPLLLYGYGSYGATIDPHFSSVRLSLLDRGFIFAIAHIRGSEYLGRNWYETGKLLHKKNTFKDFISCSIHLIKEEFTSSEHLYAMGGSAGGLLIGAVINQAPELYKGVIAAVPFVDVVTTMLDDSIPLTTGEYDEWGNPNDPLYYNYMKSYSPYDNVKAQDYPNIFITTGFYDSQVQYWEPAKWVAKLRELKTDNNKLLFKTNMDAGHSGASGRFESLKEDAEEYAFLLELEGITS